MTPNRFAGLRLRANHSNVEKKVLFLMMETISLSFFKLKYLIKPGNI